MQPITAIRMLSMAELMKAIRSILAHFRAGLIGLFRQRRGRPSRLWLAVYLRVAPRCDCHYGPWTQSGLRWSQSRSPTGTAGTCSRRIRRSTWRRQETESPQLECGKHTIITFFFCQMIQFIMKMKSLFKKLKSSRSHIFCPDVLAFWNFKSLDFNTHKSSICSCIIDEMLSSTIWHNYKPFSAL